MIESQLLIPHKLSNKIGNKTTTINDKEILNEYLHLCKQFSKTMGKVNPYTFSYFVENKLESKCSLSSFKNIMKRNLIASHELGK